MYNLKEYKTSQFHWGKAKKKVDYLQRIRSENLKDSFKIGFHALIQTLHGIVHVNKNWVSFKL